MFIPEDEHARKPQQSSINHTATPGTSGRRTSHLTRPSEKNLEGKQDDDPDSADTATDRLFIPDVISRSQWQYNLIKAHIATKTEMKDIAKIHNLWFPPIFHS